VLATDFIEKMSGEKLGDRKVNIKRTRIILVLLF